jgi:cell shape-determining protein MreC
MNKSFNETQTLEAITTIIKNYIEQSFDKKLNQFTEQIDEIKQLKEENETLKQQITMYLKLLAEIIQRMIISLLSNLQNP